MTAVPGGLLRTSSFRLAVGYTAVFGLSALLAFALIFSLTEAALDRETNGAIEAEIVVLSRQYDRFGLNGLAALVAQRSAGSRQAVYLLTDRWGRRLEGNLAAWPDRLSQRGGFIEFPRATGSGAEAGSATGGGVLRARAFLLPGGFSLVVGRDLSERQRFRQELLQAMAWAAGAMVLVGLGGGLLVGWRSMRRVAVMVAATTRVVGGAAAGALDITPAAGDGAVADAAPGLAARIPVSGRGDELDQLAGNVNAMLDRLARLLDGMRQVTDNVAHDLRGPLTRLKTRLEVTLLAGPDTAPAYRAALEQTVAEANAVLATFNALLDIATAEAGSLRDALAPVDLAALAADMADLYLPAAEEAGLALSLHGPAGDGVAVVDGHRHLLGQAIANLIDNAVKHGRPAATPAPGKPGAGDAVVPDAAAGEAAADGGVRIAVTRTAAGVALTVADRGPGIAAADRHRAVQRFVRLAPDRGGPGNGLGLSLVAATARLHGARLALEDNGPGLRVRLDFPAGRRDGLAG